jgi:hypothetical protein
VAVDAAGNVCIVGSLKLTVDFGGGPVTAEGWSDMFIVRLSPRPQASNVRTVCDCR